MFTGIVEATGKIARADRQGEAVTLVIATDLDPGDIGASLAIDGTCLTVTAKTAGALTAVVGPETLAKTTLGALRVGDEVNLERPMRLGDRLGGHLVLGHVDGVGTLLERTPDGGSIRLTLEAPSDLARFIAPKGSVAIDGVSMTVNEVSGRRFGVNVIPITQRETNLAQLTVGGRVNLEIDMMARYVARLMAKDGE